MLGKSICLTMLVGLIAVGLRAQRAEQCTTALFSPAASASGRPMLWKNRDTDVISNKVVLVRDQPFAYLALVDADDASGRRAYAGPNAAGFAIINTVAYNLPAAQSGDLKDLEGNVMQEYLNLAGLDNRAGTGFLPRLLSVEDGIFRRVEAFGMGPKTSAELAELQEELASAALAAMKGIQP